jgi:hypothetical protein
MGSLRISDWSASNITGFPAICGAPLGNAVNPKTMFNICPEQVPVAVRGAAVLVLGQILNGLTPHEPWEPHLNVGDGSCLSGANQCSRRRNPISFQIVATNWWISRHGSSDTRKEKINGNEAFWYASE